MGSSAPDEEACFLTEQHCLHDLLKGLHTPCPCGKTSNGKTSNAWSFSSSVQVLYLVVFIILCIYSGRQRF